MLTDFSIKRIQWLLESDGVLEKIVHVNGSVSWLISTVDQ